jgi:hypothetical protein
MPVSTRFPIAAMILLAVGCLVCPLQAQVPVGDLRLLEGPWECRNSSGIHGFFVTAVTTLAGKAEQREITSRSVNIGVYQRHAGQERWGYFSPGGDPNGSTVFDGKRLIIHFKDRTDLPPFDLDVKFDPATRRWTGLWSLCDQSKQVVLERPRPAVGVHPGAFVGDWEGTADPTAKFPAAPGTLHVRQGDDGGVTAWLDRTRSAYDPRTQSTRVEQRNGERLSVLSATRSAIVLATPANFPGAHYRYEATLSADGSSMRGQWRSGVGGGASLDAPTLYRLVDRSTGGN